MTYQAFFLSEIYITLPIDEHKPEYQNIYFTAIALSSSIIPATKSFEEIDNTCPWLMGHLVKINNGRE